MIKTRTGFKGHRLLSTGLALGLLAVGTAASAQTLYVTNSSANTLSMVPVDQSKAAINITVGNNPQAVAVSRDGRYAYTANASDNTVSAINTATQSVIGAWNTGALPYAVAVSADGSKLYVANNVSDTISVLNATTGATLQTLTVGNEPIGLTVSPNGNYLAVSHYGAGDAHIFDISGASAVAYATATIGGWHYAAAFSADSSMAYFPTSSGFVPFNLDTQTQEALIATGASSPHAIAISSNNTFYQPGYNSTNLYYGAAGGSGPFSEGTVGSKSTGMALNSAGSILYIADYGTHGNATTGSVKAYPVSNFPSPVTYTSGGNPSGVVYSEHDFTPAVAVPTLTEWAMILFAMVLAGFAALTLQRRRQTD